MGSLNKNGDTGYLRDANDNPVNEQALTADAKKNTQFVSKHFEIPNLKVASVSLIDFPTDEPILRLPMTIAADKDIAVFFIGATDMYGNIRVCVASTHANSPGTNWIRGDLATEPIFSYRQINMFMTEAYVLNFITSHKALKHKGFSSSNTFYYFAVKGVNEV